MSYPTRDARSDIRASGDYATYDAQEFFAYRMRDRIWLYSNDDPLPPGFDVSSYDWVRGEKEVLVTDLQRLTTVRTTGVWHGHHFRVGIIVDGVAAVTYLGKDFDEVSDLPGMERPDKYEVLGEVPVSELTDVQEHVDDVPLDDSPTRTQRRDHQ